MTSILKFRPWLAPLIILLIALLPWMGLGTGPQRQIMMIAVYTLLVSGLNLTFGYAGEVVLGQVAVMAVGAYAAALLFQANQTDLAIAIPVSIAAAVIVGLLTGLPGLRLGHLSLGLITFFLVLLIPGIAQTFEGITGGYTGLFGIARPTFFGISLADPKLFFVFSILVAGVWLLLLRNLVNSRFGSALKVLKQSPVLGSSLGQSTTRLRLTAYIIGSVPAGVAGVLFAYLTGYIAPSVFTMSLTIAVLAASVVGGSQSVWGAPIGAALLVLGPLNAAEFQLYSLLVYGVFLVLVATLFSKGVAGLLNSLGRRIVHRFPRLSFDRPVETVGAELSVPGEPLSVRSAKKSFGGVHALRGVDFDAKPGRVTALLGPNGAGKTTLLNAISAVFPLDEGEVSVGDGSGEASRPDTKRTTMSMARLGIGRTFQTPIIPETMTVAEVAESGRLRTGPTGLFSAVFRLPHYFRVAREDRAAAHSALKLVDLQDKRNVLASSLPLSTRRLLEVVRAVAGQPKVLLLDEPAAGMDDDALSELRRLLLKLRDAGATIVIVEHNISFVLGVADDVYVMERGEMLAHGTPDEIRRNERVISSYLGKSHGVAQEETDDSVRNS